ncbi:MAG: hypothetical protein AAF616_16300 [Bacteroidota bacterium]
MTIKKILIATLITLTWINFTSAQNISFIARTNLSIGTEYQNIDYNGGNLLYSPGGGIGIELGLQVPLVKGFAIQSTLGYQQNLALQAESVNGVSNRSSVSFNRKLISLGLSKGFKLSDGTIKSLQLGVGSNLNFPGTLKRIENDERLGESNYNSNIGLYFEIALRIAISEGMYLDPAIRYRQLDFSVDSFSDGPTTDLPGYLQALNANGIELGVTFVKEL